MEKKQTTSKFDYIPISASLIDHVRRIDGFSSAQLGVLKKLLLATASQVVPEISLGLISNGQNPDLKRFLEQTLKIHQVFALVDVSYEPVLPTKTVEIRTKNLHVHFHELIDQLSLNNGLNYVPRERTNDGRVYEAAADSSILIEYLCKLEESMQMNEKNEERPMSKNQGTQFYVHLQNDDEKSQPQDLKVTQNQIVLHLRKEFINIAIQANGLLDLYFYAYFWDQYLTELQPSQLTQAAKDSELGSIDLTKNIDQYPFIIRWKALQTTLTKVSLNVKKFPFNEEQYKKFVQEFAKRDNTKKQTQLELIQRALFVSQIADDREALYWIEKLLVQLQGYCDITIRDSVVVLLNMLYDGVDWQIPEAFRPVIRVVGQHLSVNVIVHKKPGVFNEDQLFIGMNSPSPLEGCNKCHLTWHKIQPHNIVGQDNIQAEIQLNFGKFWKCGFYDWRMISISSEGKLAPLEIIGKPEPQYPTVDESEYGDNYEPDEEVGSIAQGRFVVHARGMRDHSFHEVQVDAQNAKVDHNNHQFLDRGTFEEVAHAIPDYAKQGINALYLMGTLERDNYPFHNQYHGGVQYRKDDASPLAAIDRATPNKMLGGKSGLRRVMSFAKENGMKVIVDCLARISSSRFNRKYKNLLLHYLDEDGRRHICYGTDGQAQKFEDTAMLNYRKLEAWNLLIDEVLAYTKEYGFDGIHLDNGQAWPQIMEPDIEELSRMDVDGEPYYTPEDFLNGEVVIRNENYGYWNTNNMETYANPFFVKLCRKLWAEDPSFMIIGECWGGFMFEHRQIIMARSGVIPRCFKLPMAISSQFGKRLQRDGSLEQCPKDHVGAIKRWYDESRRFLPNGTIMLQSSTSHNLPYPAYLYGKGTWAAIDIQFFMPDQPITFMGELEGQVYRVGDQRSVFQAEQNVIGGNQEIKRTNSQIMRALQGEDDEESNDTRTTQASQLGSSSTAAPEQRRGIPKVRSGLNIGANYVEASQGQMQQKEQQFKQQLDAGQGFDLTKINTHYMHRRRLRKEKMVLRYGEYIALSARDQEFNLISDVLVYARYSLMETVIIATSLADHSQRIFLDLSQLLPTFKKNYPNNTVVMIKNVISDENEEPQYFFLREFIEWRQFKMLPAYRSFMISVTICDDDQFIFKRCLTNSIERTKRNLISGQSIETEQISLLFSDCIENTPTDIHRFADVIGSIQSSFLDKLNVSFRDLFYNNQKLIKSVELSARLTAMTDHILKNAQGQDMSPPVRAAKAMNESNRLGPIVFCTPELGRWSTVGGLGVMVDELSIGLADLGQDVWVISPYYERNRKGETGYLAKDPAGIYYKDNVHVNIGCGYTLGVHEGNVRGVKLAFLHNGDIFPSPYPECKPDYAVTQISVFAKACLEFCCVRGIIPSMCITNDWFTGLVAAYARRKHFGDTFDGTKFLHICHNLQESYEGRIYLDPVHGDLADLHQLDPDWLIDKGWAKKLINPSRCAIMISDTWATVSKSYRQDLLNSSTLAWLLRQKPDPFAFSNGIPIAERVKKLDKAAPDHKTAKKILQQKYFNFGDLDDTIPLFGFVGRVVAQKGVLLILDIVEHVIQKFNYKVQFLIGGPANMNDPYAAQCAHRMWKLKAQYPHCFWAAPEEFFTDGAVVNRGCDFGLMPSVFEPGGIVQHEFFVGGTPVVAFKTGGLKDSVIEFLWDSEEGCGYTFESHTPGDFIFAIERAVGTFQNKQKYLKLRENAFKATLDGEIVSRAWLNEFYRLHGKKFIDYTIVNDLADKLLNWSPHDYQPISIIQEIFGTDKKRQIFQDLDHGAEDEKKNSPDKLLELDTIVSSFDEAAYSKRPKSFGLPNRGPRHNRVEICGSFDDWKLRHDLTFDPFTNQWFTTLHLKPGVEFYYKYIVNNDNWIINEDEPKIDDGAGNVNNACQVYV